MEISKKDRLVPNGAKVWGTDFVSQLLGDRSGTFDVKLDRVAYYQTSNKAMGYIQIAKDGEVIGKAKTDATRLPVAEEITEGKLVKTQFKLEYINKQEKYLAN